MWRHKLKTSHFYSQGSGIVVVCILKDEDSFILMIIDFLSVVLHYQKLNDARNTSKTRNGELWLFLVPHSQDYDGSS